MQGVPSVFNVSPHARARWAERTDRPPTMPVAEALELPPEIVQATWLYRNQGAEEQDHQDPLRIALCGLAALLIRGNTVTTVVPLPPDDLALVLTWFLLGEVV